MQPLTLWHASGHLTLYPYSRVVVVSDRAGRDAFDFDTLDLACAWVARYLTTITAL